MAIRFSAAIIYKQPIRASRAHLTGESVGVEKKTSEGINGTPEISTYPWLSKSSRLSNSEALKSQASRLQGVGFGTEALHEYNARSALSDRSTVLGAVNTAPRAAKGAPMPTPPTVCSQSTAGISIEREAVCYSVSIPARLLDRLENQQSGFPVGVAFGGTQARFLPIVLGVADNASKSLWRGWNGKVSAQRVCKGKPELRGETSQEGPIVVTVLATHAVEVPIFGVVDGHGNGF
ncbi:hypothetical protein B0H16DRAFT_1696990 [Mycena metata]|uniref:Uncharacterized protein n=1 Tax=Mycena metata TaxID=1033252 RepID=A0AAD7HYA4_9AGAR|nr:hypothetical protein B0H16DRAFT_1696990 [Mycena metata]